MINGDKKGGERMITIYTLGDFDIKKQDKSILSNENYSYKLIKLFKFF